MNWTLFLVHSFLCIAICDGWRDHGNCDCDINQNEKQCACNQYDVYENRVCLVVIASVLGVGVAGIIVCCCLYNRKSKCKQIKTDQGKFQEANQLAKQPLPEVFWPEVIFPPAYTTLPYYHPESRDSSITVPPPYSDL